jgi:two-component system chemotaxis sensor kinase CheA
VKNLQQKLLTAFEAEHKDHLEAIRLILDAAESAAWDGASLNFIELHRRLHSLKGAARAVDMLPVEKLAHALEGLIEDCRAGGIDLGIDAAGAVRQALDAIEDWVAAALAQQAPSELDNFVGIVEAARAGASPGAHPKTAPPPMEGRETARKSASKTADAAASVELTRIETRNFDALTRCCSEILSAMGLQDEILREFKTLQNETKALGRALCALPRRDAPAQPRNGWNAPAAGWNDDCSIRLQRMERLLYSTQSRQRAYSWRVRRLGRSLQDQVRLLQTVSADSIFGATRKIVRDIAQEQGKKVRVTVRGLETLADRTVLQRLKDPALHLLRNAVNHGIETPEERARLDKPEEGNIVFEITARGSELLVTVEDDGRGVNRARALDMARKKGLVAPGAEAPLGDQALTALLAHPGLSTAEIVTEVAGRGIGLSVVKETVAKLGGAFVISARNPYGTRALIAAPSSVLAMRFVLAQAGDNIFCIQTNHVEKIHSVPRGRIEMIEGRAHFVDASASPMALAPLPFLLGLGGAALASEDGALTVVELANAGTRFGVIVDLVMGVRDGILRDIGLDSERAGAVLGAVVLEDGAVVSMLDAAALWASYQRAEARCVMPADDAQERSHAPTILIVDDSITTRTLEKSVLEANGYDVRLSVDGADALRQLRLRSADLVISDIEMPILDGFGLLAAMKKDPTLARIPVVLVTSRNDDADRRRGLQLGADAYIVKQRFSQQELLTIIGRLL